MSEKKRRPRTRLSRGVFVSMCLVAAFVLAVGTGIFAHYTQNSSSGTTEHPSATNLDDSVAEVSTVKKDQVKPLEIENDPDLGNYEKDTVLVLVDNEQERDQVSNLLAESEFLRAQDVTNQDISAGFVRVEIESGTSMKQAIESLAKQGLQAQPNYVYYPLEEAPGTSARAESANEQPLSSEDPVETAGQTLAANEQGAVDQGASARDASAPLNDLDAVAQLFTGDSDTAANSENTTEADGAIFASQDAAGAASDAVSINDPGASSQWMLQSMNLYQAWKIAKGKEDNASSPSVSVAVVDTGCLYTHEDLQGNIRATYNSETGQIGIDQITDADGHGTHVAGIVAADANNGKGVAGTSYDAGLVIVKASEGETRNFTTATLAQAYTWLMSSDGSQTIAQKYNVRVVNMSVGGEATVKPDNIMYKNITKAKNAGILTVCAAGNQEGNSIPPYDCIPGDYEDCLTVINLLKNDVGTPNDSSGTMHVERSSSSNYNGESSTAKNISAPGTAIYSTLNNSDSLSYGYKSGTSMASPAVAGVAALLFAYDPSLSAEAAREILEQTATDIGAEGWDRETGYGEVDAYHALQVLSAEIKNEEVSEGSAIDLRDASDQAMDPSEWTWISDNPSVLAVDADSGALEVKGSGYATLKATHKRASSRTIEKQVRVGDATPIVDLSAATVSNVSERTFTGEAITPTPTVYSSDGRLLVLGQDYELQYGENIAAGYGTIIISPAPNSTATRFKMVKFKIAPVQFTSLNTAIRGVQDLSYTGAAQTHSNVVVSFNGNVLQNNVDYTVEYRTLDDAVVQPRAAGDYKLVVKGKGNYVGTREATFSIVRSQEGDQGGSSDNTGNTGNTGGNQGSNAGNAGGTSGTTGGSTTTTPGGNTGSSGNAGNSGSATTPAQTPDKAPAVTGTWKKSGGKWWFSYSASTKAAQGGKSWPTNEWVSIKGKKYHFDAKGYMHTNWQRLDGKWYYFAGDGAMRTGWQKVKGAWYYLASDGVMQTGKKTIGSATYYLNPSSGAMKTGWNNESSGWHYYASSGAMAKGWLKTGGKWYYLDPSSGIMKTGFYDVGTSRYCSNSSGVMLTGWRMVANKWYYFSGSGVMQKNKWIGNYYVGSDGVMATGTWIGKYHVNASGKWDVTR